ncbi:sensor histidine kinase, partial [Streptomyces sp. NPDC001156]
AAAAAAAHAGRCRRGPPPFTGPRRLVSLLSSPEPGAESPRPARARSDLRRLLGLLRPDGERADLDPQASLDDLSNLLETARSTGHPVRFTQSGTPRPLPPAISLAAYRIVQEALTNARRHGAPGLTVVRLDWGDSALHLDIVNPVHAGERPGTAGHGLLGMAERVRLFGGSLNTGSDREGWAVRATLPMPMPMPMPIMEHAAR